MSSKSSRKSIKSAVKKATRTSWSPPKEKHVKRLVLATFARDGIEEIVNQLHRRFTKNNWVVILKTLMVFHKIMREGDQFFMESLKNKAHALFALRNFTGNPNNVYVIFVRKYAKYLDEKVSVFRLLNLQFEKHHDAFKTASVDALIKQVPKLQSQFNALLNCRLRAQYIGGNTLIIAALMMMLRDSLTVYPMLNSGVLALINVFTKLRRSEAEKVLEIYKLFVRETDALIAMYEVGRSFARNLPEINKVATHLIDTFTKHIATLPVDDVAASLPLSNPSESVSFDEYVPETEPAPYDLKDAFPGADSDSSASDSSGEVDDDIMKGYDLRDSLPAGRPKPLTKQLSHGGESPAMQRKNLTGSGDWRKNSTGGASGSTSPKTKAPFETKVFSATAVSNPSLDWGYSGNNQQPTIFSPPVQNNYAKVNNNTSVDEFFSTAKSQPTMNPFVTPAQNPAPVQTGPLGVTITPQPTFDMMTHNFNTQLNPSIGSSNADTDRQNERILLPPLPPMGPQVPALVIQFMSYPQTPPNFNPLSQFPNQVYYMKPMDYGQFPYMMSPIIATNNFGWVDPIQHPFQQIPSQPIFTNATNNGVIIPQPQESEKAPQQEESPPSTPSTSETTPPAKRTKPTVIPTTKFINETFDFNRKKRPRKKSKAEKLPDPQLTETVKELLKQYELNQKSLAVDVGSSETMVSQWINGTAKATGWGDFETKIRVWLNQEHKKPDKGPAFDFIDESTKLKSKFLRKSKK